jgi:hypothetical protein
VGVLRHFLQYDGRTFYVDAQGGSSSTEATAIVSVRERMVTGSRCSTPMTDLGVHEMVAYAPMGSW